MKELILNQKTMNSIQLSEMIKMDKKEVHRKIKSMFQSKIDGGEITPSLDSRGYVISYLLPELESKMFVAKNDISYLEKITKFWIDSSKESQFKIPQTLSEALQLASNQALTIEKQSASLENKDKLLLATNEASIKAGEILIRQFVKSVDIIDLGEKQFFKWLKEQKYITAKNEPYQKFVALGYFTFKPTDIEHGGKFRYTLRITGRGKVWLSAKYMEFLDND